MANHLSWNLFDTSVQKALMTPHIPSSDLILHLVVANTMQRDPKEPYNQPKMYFEFVNDSKLYHTIITRYALDPWFSNTHLVA